MLNKVFKRRFEELEEQASQLESAKKVLQKEIIGIGKFIDSDLLFCCHNRQARGDDGGKGAAGNSGR